MDPGPFFMPASKPQVEALSRLGADQKIKIYYPYPYYVSLNILQILSQHKIV